MITTDFHIHTAFCDGRDTPEEIVLKALEKGFTAIGFSGHSYTDMDSGFAMNADTAAEYRRVINELKLKYSGRIKILCGIEQDYFSTEPTGAYDYVIGSVHYVYKNGKYISVDNTAEIIRNAVNTEYGGDFDALAEDYFALAGNVPDKTGADIIGHFDLVSKFSEQNGYGQSPRFLAAAEKAVERLVKYGKPFEINTGAMARGMRSVPYPTREILLMIKEYGGKVILSSDCHDKNYLGFAFDKAEKLARECGFCELITEIGFQAEAF